MSLAELKKEAASLTEAERRELAEFLTEHSKRQARTNETMREMDAGQKHSRADFEAVADERNELACVAEASGSLDFLKDEPDLYSDADVIPARANRAFGSAARHVQAR